MTDQTLDSIMSGAPAPVVAPEPLVDEPETVITDPVPNEIDTDLVEGEPHPDEKTGEPDPKIGAAFKAQREGQAKRYTEQVADFERKLEAQNAAWEQRFERLLQSVTPKTPAETPDFYTDPQAAVRNEIQPAVQSFAEQMQAHREATSRMMAMEKHGNEAVTEAYGALADELRTNPAAQFEYQRIMASPHPFGELVTWHQKQSVLKDIGTDPNAYREKVRAELLAEIQSTGHVPAAPQRTTPAAPLASMPSNLADARNAGARAGPAWAGPPSLTDIFQKG